MEKNEVYIDFEAITNPFARLLNLPSGTPYAYTIGLLSDKNQYETKTFIINFAMHNSLSSIWVILKKFIIADITKINSKLNLKDIVFVGHNPVLETKCIKKIFPNNEIKPLIANQTVSLSKLTGKTFFNNYFPKIKKILLEKSKEYPLFLQLIEKNGAIASFAGYWLYTNSLTNLRTNDKKRKFYIDLDKKLLLKELKNYSKDDVNKMLYVIELEKNNLDLLIKEVNQKKEFLKILKSLNINDNLTIKEIKEKIWSL